jgi:ADP-ribose pyrophosphatase
VTKRSRKVKVIAEGQHVRLVSRDGWEYADRPKVSGIVIIVAVTKENKVLLVEQHRPPVGGPVVELPAGLAGDVAGQEEEALEEAARRELLEETGYRAESFTKLFEGPPSAGVSSEVLTFFRAEGLTKVTDGGGDESEDIQIHEVPLDQITQWLLGRAETEGVQIDPKIFAGLFFVK